MGWDFEVAPPRQAAARPPSRRECRAMTHHYPELDDAQNTARPATVSTANVVQGARSQRLLSRSGIDNVTRNDSLTGGPAGRAISTRLSMRSTSRNPRPSYSSSVPLSSTQATKTHRAPASSAWVSRCCASNLAYPSLRCSGATNTPDAYQESGMKRGHGAARWSNVRSG